MDAAPTVSTSAPRRTAWLQRFGSSWSAVASLTRSDHQAGHLERGGLKLACRDGRIKCFGKLSRLGMDAEGGVQQGGHWPKGSIDPPGQADDKCPSRASQSGHARGHLAVRGLCVQAALASEHQVGPHHRLGQSYLSVDPIEPCLDMTAEGEERGP
jgi:hypothetical protein